MPSSISCLFYLLFVVEKPWGGKLGVSGYHSGSLSLSDGLSPTPGSEANEMEMKVDVAFNYSVYVLLAFTSP